MIKRIKIVIILPFLLMAILFFIGKTTQLDRVNPSNRYIFHAIPSALSFIYCGWPHDYTASFSMAMRFQSQQDKLPDLIANVAAQPEKYCGREKYYWVADDKGSLDIIAAGFLLFGTSIESMYYFYFLMIFGAIITFLFMHKHFNIALRTLSLTISSLAVCFFIWYTVNTQTGMAGFGENSINLGENRMYGVLAVLPTLAIFFLIIQRSPISRWQLVGAVGQVLFLIGLFHARSSTMWIVAPLIVISLFRLLVTTRLRTGEPEATATRTVESAMAVRSRIQLAGAWRWLRSRNGAVVIMLIMAGLGLKSAYQHVMYDGAYFAERGQRTVWHNIVMGLGESPFFNTELGLASMDRLAVEAIIRFENTGILEVRDQNLNESALAALDEEATNALNALGSHVVYDWSAYERRAREYFQAVVDAYPTEVLATYLWHKPMGVVATLAALFFDPTNLNVSAAGIPLIYPTLGALFLVAFAGFFRLAGSVDREINSRLYPFLGLCLLFSLAAPIAIYSSYVTLADFTMVLLILVFTSVYQLAAWIGGSLVLRHA